MLLERLRLPGRLGALRFARAGKADIPAGLPARVLGAEQSNSSLVYGERLILKLFRRVVPGVNPDLELPRALAAGRSTRVPAPLAWLEADGGDEPLVLGVLQPFCAAAKTAGNWRSARSPAARTSPARRGRSAGPPPRCTRRWPRRCPP
ncbi:Maltokinase [Streptomyces diastaticus subsp. diastaticus]